MDVACTNTQMVERHPNQNMIVSNIIFPSTLMHLRMHIYIYITTPLSP